EGGMDEAVEAVGEVFILFAVGVEDVGFDGRRAGLGDLAVAAGEIEERAGTGAEPVDGGALAGKCDAAGKRFAVLRGFYERDAGGDGADPALGPTGAVLHSLVETGLVDDIGGVGGGN